MLLTSGDGFYIEQAVFKDGGCDNRSVVFSFKCF